MESGKIVKTSNNQIQSKDIKKQLQYTQLIEMVKQGKYLSARLTAKALNIDFTTILKWIKTDKVQQVAKQTINKYVEGIEKHGEKDWRAYDKLLNYAVNGLEQQGQQIGQQTNILVYNNDSKVAVSI